jgi:hypothetical protein
MILKKNTLIKVSFILILIIIITFYIVYTNSIKPKLIFKCSLNNAIEKCPDIEIWAREHNTWEFIPNTYISKIYDNEINNKSFLFGTYEFEIIDFIPNCFHSTYGELKKKKGEKKTIYIYEWNKKYEPNMI